MVRSWDRSFLGFSVRREDGLRRCIDRKAIARFKRRVRLITGRHRGVSLEQMIRDLTRYLRGWAGYFGLSQMSELRCAHLTAGFDVSPNSLVAVLPKAWIQTVVASAKGPWRWSTTRPLTRAFSEARLRRLGLVSMASLVDT